MPVKSKAKFNSQGLKSRVDNLRFDIAWEAVIPVAATIVIGGVLSLGALGVFCENKLEDGRSLVIDDKTYELVDENSIKETNDSLSNKYNFEARVVVTEAYDDDGEVIDQTIVRFEETSAPDKIEDARQAGVKIADQLQVIFEGAKDRQDFNDEEMRPDLIEDAQDFKEKYGTAQAVPTPSPRGGQ